MIPRGASGIGPFGFLHGDSCVGYYSLPSIDQYEYLTRNSGFMMDWSLGPGSAMAPMGYYLLVDLFTRLGRTREAGQELIAARAQEGHS